MSEWITGRNPAFEILRAKRRQIKRLLVAKGTQRQGRLAEIINLAKQNMIPVDSVPRSNLDGIDPHHQGLALETGGYPYSDIEKILQIAESHK
ncbi:MAG: RNA methyltransferase substrate-binding domain-containing protein [Brevefilum sp.]